MDDETVDPQIFLKIFKNLNHDKNHSENPVISHLQHKLIATIKDEKFLPDAWGENVSINQIELWRHDFVDCFDLGEVRFNFDDNEYPWDTSQNERFLASTETNKIFYDELIEEYGCFKVTVDYAYKRLAKYPIKNDSPKDRKKILKTISAYAEDDNDVSYFDVEEIKVFTNIQGEICSLEECSEVPKGIPLPKILKPTNRLSEDSHKMIQQYLCETQNEDFNNHFLEHYINPDVNNFISTTLIKQIENLSEGDWNNHGWEIWAFLLKQYTKRKDALKEALNNDDVKSELLLPELKKGKDGGEWKAISGAYFSKSWLNDNGALQEWLDQYGAYNEFAIGNKDSLWKKIENAKGKKHLSSFSKETLENLFEDLGVESLPSLRLICGYDHVLYTEKYREYLRQERSNFFFWNDRNKHINYYYPKIDKYINYIPRLKRLKTVLELLKKAAIKPAEIHVNSTGYSTEKDSNLAIFDLKNTKWLQFEPSAIRTDGLFSPSECFWSNEDDGKKPIIPLLSKEYFSERGLNQSEIEDLCEKLNLKENRPTKENWKDWLETLANGYESMIENREDVKTQPSLIKDFMKTLCESTWEEDLTLEGSDLPCYDHKGNFTFLPSDEIFWNNTPLKKEDIFKIEGLNEWGYFILDRLKYNRPLNEKGLVPLSDIIDIIPEYETDDDQEILNELQDKWLVIEVLCNAYNIPQKRFDDFKKAILLCKNESIILNISMKQQDGECTPLPFDKWKLENQDKTLVRNDRDIIIKFLTHDFLERSKEYLNFKSLLDVNPKNDDELKTVLEDIGLDPDLFVDFKNLFPEKPELKPDIQPKPPESPKPTPETDRDDDASSTIPVSTSHQVKRRSENRSEKSKNPFKNSSNENQKPSRPRVDREGIPVSLLTEGGNSDPEKSKKIGDAAEEIINKKLREEFPDAEIKLFGGSNPGYDIKVIREDGTTYYVEVKGTEKNWGDPDVNISLQPRQCEKAIEEGEHFWLYVVEEVKSETEYGAITLIKNPWRYVKILPLDARLKQFGEKL